MEGIIFVISDILKNHVLNVESSAEVVASCITLTERTKTPRSSGFRFASDFGLTARRGFLSLRVGWSNLRVICLILRVVCE